VQLRELEALAAGDGFTEQQAEAASIDEVGDFAMAEGHPSEETRRTTQEAVREEANDLPIELNDAVLACIELYQGRLRDWFSAALARGGRYMPTIRQVFAEEGIPQDLACGAGGRLQAPGPLEQGPGRLANIAATGPVAWIRTGGWTTKQPRRPRGRRRVHKTSSTVRGLNLALAGSTPGSRRCCGARPYGVADCWSLRRTRALRAGPERR
jgi:membrane-bound lytic murein transglycosylase D